MFKKSFLLTLDEDVSPIPSLEQITKAITLYAKDSKETLVFKDLEENNVTFYLNDELYKVNVTLLRGCTCLKCIKQ